MTEEQAELEHVLAAKFLTKHALNLDAIAKTFTPIWRSKNGFKVQREGVHIVLFTFDDKSEMAKILATKPWSFDKHLMVLQHYDKEVDLTEMEFKWATFWVQVHDIPIQFRNRRVVEQICGAIGTVNVVSDENGAKGDGFIRIRVTIDVSKHLCRGHMIPSIVVRNYGCRSSTNDSQIYAIGVVALRMTTGTVSNGLNLKEACQVNLSSSDHGYVPHCLFHQEKT